jgi:tyrosinase
LQRDYKTTVRYPGETDPQKRLIEAIKIFYETPGKKWLPPLNPERNLTERVSYILRAYQRYGPMSHNRYKSDNNDDKTKDAEIWGSLEDIHNAVHDLTGGGGHMGSIPISAFDPIFWLHHTYVAISTNIPPL